MRQTKKSPMSADLPGSRHAYWRAAKYLSVGQMYRDDLITHGTLKMAQEALVRA